MTTQLKKTAKVEIQNGDYTVSIEGGIFDEWDSEWTITFKGNEKIYGSFALYKSYTREDYFCDNDDLIKALWEEIDWFQKKYADITITELEVEVEVEDDEELV